MEDVRKADPKFTDFLPRTAADAVDRYVRCRKNGLKPMLVPECLIECARGLPEKELGLFEQWIINPNDDFENMKLVPDTIRADNEKIYQANVKRVEAELPPLPLDVDDEKLEEVFEDLQPFGNVTVAQEGNSSSSSPHSTPST